MKAKGGINIDWDGLQSSFYDFLGNVTIISKDEGRVRLQMYDAQRYFFDEIFDGLRKDIHWFVTGKGRQLGITTACLIFDVFYAGAVPGIQGGLVFDKGENKEKFRKLLTAAIRTLPRTHQLPVLSHNREGLVITGPDGQENMFDYLIAGTKKGVGNIGNSRALNFCHGTETCYWGDADALEKFKDCLSSLFPYRLYIFESTANGPNLFYDLWEEAAEDELSKRCIFVGWWRKRSYSYDRGTALFKRYGWTNLSEDEKKAAEIVKRDYGHKITLQQWAWYRHRADPTATEDHSEDLGERDDRAVVVTQEHPHFPEQMWEGTGSPFIPPEYLAPAFDRAHEAKFRGYHYALGTTLETVRIHQVTTVRQSQLKVWEEPSPLGVYVIGADTAYGSSDEGDACVAQVVRCYADKMVQVAEFCDRNIQPYQFAWVLLHLCGWYGDCRFVMELYGAGEAVWTEVRNLKREVEDGRLQPPIFAPAESDIGMAEAIDPSNFRNVFARVRQFLYRRQDTLGGGGLAYQVRATQDIKFTYLTQFGDRFMLGQFDILSVQALNEIRRLRKDGRSIAAEGRAKDDRPVALGLATKGYMDQERRELVAREATFEREQQREREGGGNDSMASRYHESIMRGAFASKARERRQAFRSARRGGRWSW